MLEKRMYEKFYDFKNALERLNEALNMKIDEDIIIDGIIQRFEFTFELSWKLMKSYLEYEGIDVNSPRSTIRKAFENKLIDDGDAWIDMMVDRNKTSHTYDREAALEIYNNIKRNHIKYLKDLKSKFEEILFKKN